MHVYTSDVHFYSITYLLTILIVICFFSRM